jgi:Protein of unknown function (DUF2970)
MSEGIGNNKTSALSGMRAVLWSFFGVRSKSEHQADITRLSMTQIIVSGVIGAVLFVSSLIALVYFVTR